ncbi:hypothetical protein LTS08_006153 [Lithohypha guttulata]|uniref:uncharacterized protein n=1 Tax=Lithohypha guttulata TaxID=1690604 RepID=UPI002DDF4421|nr:hypothetical protein LTR51_002844 [Lithohypha guttulata]KAK5098775.1 hypothetical protein LTS08_006153 [Lithohypha guttulata]
MNMNWRLQPETNPFPKIQKDGQWIASPPFKRKPIRQSSSRFMQMPGEVHEKILRFCLKSDKPLTPSISPTTSKGDLSYGRSAYSPYSRWPLSSQLLRVSQDLYREARHVLYSDNVLSITWQTIYGPPRRVPEYSCTILGASIVYSDHHFDWSSEWGTDLLSLVSILREERKRWEPDTEWLEQIYPALLQFDKVQVVMQDTIAWGYFHMSKTLQNVLKNKKVVLVLPGQQGSLLKSPADLGDLLARCHSLRCKTFDVAHRSDKHEAAVQPHRWLIQSQARVSDLHDRWQLMFTKLIPQLRDIGQSMFIIRNDRAVHSLQCAMMSDNEASFELAMVEILRLTRLWITELEQHMQECINETGQQLLATQDSG